jgi:hypothetical protein
VYLVVCARKTLILYLLIRKIPSIYAFSIQLKWYGYCFCVGFWLRILFKYNNWPLLLYFSFQGTVVCCFRVNFVFLGRNVWPLEPFKIYNLGSNGKFIFILWVLTVWKFLRNKWISYTRELTVVTFSVSSVVSLTLMNLELFTIFANNINVLLTLVMLYFPIM